MCTENSPLFHFYLDFIFEVNCQKIKSLTHMYNKYNYIDNIIKSRLYEFVEGQIVYIIGIHIIEVH